MAACCCCGVMTAGIMAGTRSGGDAGPMAGDIFGVVHLIRDVLSSVVMVKSEGASSGDF